MTTEEATTEKYSSNILNIMGKISVTKNTGINQVHISSKSNFFDGYLIIKDNGESLTFTKPTLDYNGRMYKPKFYKKTQTYVTAIVSEMPLGKFYFDDEESTEDKLVVYYR
jgi:hypothetical protein